MKLLRLLGEGCRIMCDAYVDAAFIQHTVHVSYWQ